MGRRAKGVHVLWSLGRRDNMEFTGSVENTLMQLYLPLDSFIGRVGSEVTLNSVKMHGL